MKLISCSMVLLLLLSGCSHTRTQRSDSTTDSVPSDLGLVKGRTVHVTYGLPGALSEEPGKPIPPEPIPGVIIYFKGDGRTYTITSGQDGTYQVELPPGNYRISWICPWEKDIAEGADLFSDRHLRKELTEIEVEDGEVYERDLPVEVTFID